MLTKQEKAENLYSSLALATDKSVVAGRYAFDAGKEQNIVNDILDKIHVQQGHSFLDIGCGGSIVTHAIINYMISHDVQLTLMDIDNVIDLLETDILHAYDKSKINTIKGYFPKDFRLENVGFDRILIYSVLHYSDNPRFLIDEAIQLLNPNGWLLLGDLPNISQKGRFLSSNKGRTFEAVYRNTTIEQLPFYNNHHDFVQRMCQDTNYYSIIDDSFIKDLYSTYTEDGYDIYILPQPENLPFGNTRHDILIKRYD